MFLPRSDSIDLQHADYRHVVARESGFINWPALKFAVELLGMDRAQKRQRLKGDVHHGQFHVVEQLLSDLPDLADGDLGLEIAMFRKAAVAAAL